MQNDQVNTMKTLIKAKNINKTFFGVRALDNMSLDIGTNEIHCLIGENGSGKSTLIKIISGYYQADTGDIYFRDQLMSKITPEISIDHGIQVIYQDFSLFSNMTVAENIMLSSNISSGKKIINYELMRENAQEIIELIGTDLNPDQYVDELSVAEKQLTAICKALAQNASLIIMDEPTTALTKREVEKLFKIVNALKEKGVSILFVSHKLDEVLEISDRITVMRNGRNVYSQKDDESNPSIEELIFHMTGRKITENSYKPPQKTSSQNLLEITNYTKSGHFSNINMNVNHGEIIGVTGLLGCGRTEFAESLFGLNPADSGQVKIEGCQVDVIKSIAQALKYGIAYVPEDRLTEGLHLNQIIDENIVVCSMDDITNKFGIINFEEYRKRTQKATQTMSIKGYHPQKLVKALSGGNQQKVVLSKWLLRNPKILILNGPTVGVDIGAKAEIHEQLKRLASENKVGIIVVSDDLYELKAICNRIYIMRDGHITNHLKTEDVTVQDLDFMITKGA